MSNTQTSTDATSTNTNTSTSTSTSTTGDSTSPVARTAAFTFVEISGPDAGALRAFYRDAIGLDVAEPDDMGYSMWAPGGRPSGLGIPGAVWSADGAFPGPSAYIAPCVEVDDIERVIATAVAQGATVVVPIRDHGPVLLAHIVDPVGNRLGLFQYPAV